MFVATQNVWIHFFPCYFYASDTNSQSVIHVIILPVLRIYCFGKKSTFSSKECHHKSFFFGTACELTFRKKSRMCPNAHQQSYKHVEKKTYRFRHYELPHFKWVEQHVPYDCYNKTYTAKTMFGKKTKQ